MNSTITIDHETRIALEQNDPRLLSCEIVRDRAVKCGARTAFKAIDSGVEVAVCVECLRKMGFTVIDVGLN